MNPTPLLVAALLGLAASPRAEAVHLDPNGRGQVLIFPYYTVNGGRSTVFSVVNPTPSARALKLRFREGVKGRSVLDVNLYLGEFDSYTAALLSTGPDAPAELLGVDTSCTVPAAVGVPNANVARLPLRYEGPADGPAGVERTREGWFELIEMGVLEDTGRTPAESFAVAVQPVGGRPVDCSRVAAAWAPGGVWTQDATRAANGSDVGVSPPRGGLYGSANVVDVAQGVALTFAPEAIDGFYSLAETRLHTPPGSAKPDLSSAETAPGQARAHVFHAGQPVALDFLAGRPDAVSAVLMASSLLNEYNIEPALGAESEWLLTLPTRHLHEAQATLARRRPFLERPCVEVVMAYYDREAGPDAPAVELDPPPRRPGLCHHAQVLRWGSIASDPTPLLGARLQFDPGVHPGTRLLRADGTQVPAGYAWFGFRADHFLLDGSENAGATPRRQLFGLPLVGFWAANYVNQNAQPGVLANYSIALRHRGEVLQRRVRIVGEGLPGETIVAEPDG